MKTWNRCVFLVLVSWMVPDRYLAAQAVNIPDPALEAAIRDTLAKPEGDLTIPDMESLTELDLSLQARGFEGPVIASLSGLEAAKNLVRLNLSAAFPPLKDALRPGDQYSCYFCTDCDFGSEGPGNLFDGIPTKWVGFGVGDCAGFAISPSYGPTLIRGVSLQSANDRPEWDPKVMILKGSNSESIEDPNYELIVELPIPAWSERFQTQTLFFSNDKVYRHYLVEVKATQEETSPASHLAELELLVVRPTSLPEAQIDWSVLGALPSLTRLDLSDNQLTNLHLPQGLSHLEQLDLSDNQLTDLDLPEGLSGLTTLDLSRNWVLADVNLPGDLAQLTSLDLSENSLTQLDLPPRLSRLRTLMLNSNRLQDLRLPEGWGGLRHLDLSGNSRFSRLILSPDLQDLSLDLSGNFWLTNLVLEGDLSGIVELGLHFSGLTTLSLPRGLTNLTHLHLQYSRLTELQLPDDLRNLEELTAWGNQLTNLYLPTSLSHLTHLAVDYNQLTELTVPPTLRRLTELSISGNALGRLTLPAGGYSMDPSLAALRDQGADVTLQPVLDRVRWLDGNSVQFTLWADQGLFEVSRSPDLELWEPMARVNVDTPNAAVPFTDDTASALDTGFYRVNQVE